MALNQAIHESGCVHYVMVYKLNGSHFGLPLSSIQKMTGLGGNFKWTCDHMLQGPIGLKWN